MRNVSTQALLAQTARRKRLALIFLGGALALLFLLASSVGNLQLLQGEPFALPSGNGLEVGGSPPSGGGEILVVFMRVLLALSLAAVPIYIIMSLLSKEGRQRLLTHTITIALLVLALYALRGADIAGPEMEQATQDRPAQATGGEASLPPEAVFDETPSDTAVLATTVVVSLLLALLAAGLTVLIIRGRRKPPSALDELAQDAQEAIDTLKSGGALEETIQRCYRNMCDIVRRERHVERGIAVTPSEFEDNLLKAGMPRAAVQQLTRLFEEIRYGARQPGEREQQLAINSLSEIVTACGAARGSAR